MNKRNYNVECLRVIMMILIIMLHLSGEFYDLGKVALISNNIEISSVFGFRSLLMVGVSTFAFISGYYGISPKGRTKKLISYELMALELGGAILFLECILGKLCYRDVLVFFMPISSGCCWYFSAYMLLLVFAPIISKGLEQLTKEQFRLIVIAILVFGYLGYWVFNVLSTDFLTLLCIYLIGRYIRLYPQGCLDKLKTWHLVIAILINFAISSSLVFFGFGKAIKFIENNHNPLILITAIAFFFVFQKHKENVVAQQMSRLAKYSFPVYIAHVSLLHAGVIDFKSYQIVSPIISVILYAFVVYMVFSFVEVLRLHLALPLNRFVEKQTVLIVEKFKK